MATKNIPSVLSLARLVEDDFHQAAGIFPMMEQETFENLVQDIREHGQREPIVYYRGLVLDGRNRYLACSHLGIECDWAEVTTQEIQDDPVAYVVSQNLHRRHLNHSQRGMVSARIKEYYTRAAKERQRHHGGTAPGKSRDTCGKFTTSDSGKSRDQAGEAMGVSGKTVDYSSKVIANGTKQLVEAVDRGEVAVSKAAKIAELPKKEQKAAIEKAKQPREKPEYPVSKAYIGLLENLVKTTNGIRNNYGSFKEMTKHKGWDKSETGYASQLVVALHESLGQYRKELKDG